MTVPAFTRTIALLLCVLCVLCGYVVRASALDREAFSVTNYDLHLQIDPEQHRLGVRGKITLRNDSAVSQKNGVLQISSSLDWKSIKSGDTVLQFVTQPYASDIDHTGALSEAIVTLPRPVESHATIELEIAYEGVIVLDATRLTRIGMPEDTAVSSDWDQITPDFTGVRGVGNVAWYPIATEVANLSESNSLFEVLGRWKTRESNSKMHLQFNVAEILSSGRCAPSTATTNANELLGATCTFDPLGTVAPSFVMANYKVIERPDIVIHFLPGHDSSAAMYADTAEKLYPFITDWFRPAREKATIADIPIPSAAPFESGNLLLTPLSNTDSKLVGLSAAHQLTHTAFFSPRPWINEGIAHFAQALYLEHEKNRQAALDYIGLHRSAFLEAEKPSPTPSSDDEVRNSLVNTNSEELYRSKAMSVWWMLRDMIGDAALKKALAAYRPEDDKVPSYMQRLISAQTQRDVEWFFDDWVYRDRGLPDFKIESAFPRKTLNDSYIVTVTVDNLGTAGAEVPITMKFAGGEVTKRIEVRAKSKGTIRIETPAAPLEIVVNDGSVPESDTTNNGFKLAPSDSPK